MTKLALISDMHFGKYSRTLEFAIAGENNKDETVGGISLKDNFISILKQEKVEMLLVAGDLTSTGTPQEYDHCQKELSDITRQAGISKDNLILSFGNHDVDWQITKMAQAAYSGYSDPFPFKNVTQKYQLIAASVGEHCLDRPDFKHPGPAPFAGVIEKNNLVIFVLNSGWYCSHNQEYKHGMLRAAQLSWFKDEVQKFKKKSKWKIILLHHHPFSYPYPTPGLDISTLEEGSELLEIAGANGINLVCHGHRHHPRAKTTIESGWQQPISFICAGSISVNAEHRNHGEIPNVFHIIELSKKGYTMLLRNFEYATGEGWKPLQKNCKATPLDSEMFLGEVYKPIEIEKSLEKLVANTSANISLPSWDLLPNALKALSIEDLNEKIKVFFKATHKRVGRYPDKDVMLMRR